MNTPKYQPGEYVWVSFTGIVDKVELYNGTMIYRIRNMNTQPLPVYADFVHEDMIAPLPTDPEEEGVSNA